MRSYGLTARDAFAVIEALETCSALSGGVILLLPYLFPLIVGHIRGLDRLPEPVGLPDWCFTYPGSYQEGAIEVSIADIAKQYQLAADFDDDQLSNELNGEGVSPVIRSVARIRFGNISSDHLANPANYRSLVRAISRFNGAPPEA
jgi:hypothetical protein